MKIPLSKTMRTATRFIRAGDLSRATQEIQRALKTGTTGTGFPTPGRAYWTPRKSPAPSHTPSGGASVTASGMSTSRFTCAAGARDYCLYVPDLRGSTPAGLIVMLHGCTQTPVDFAAGTAMNRLADQHGLIILYPGQSRGANMQTCWNWFSPADQRRDAGEPAILAGMTTQIIAQHAVPKDRVFAAGLSAGGAMAVILGQTYPDMFTAIGAHSGLAYGAARDVGTALAAMKGQMQPPAARGKPRPVRTIIFQGTADNTVVPANAVRISDDVLTQISGQQTQTHDTGTLNGRGYARTVTLDDQGRDVLELWQIDGLGHAWSGGQSAGSYTDPTGPDASAEMIRFFLQYTR